MCAFPECGQRLVPQSQSHDDTIIVADLVHIVGERESAARGISKMPWADRNKAFNLMLLCPTHHRLVDRDPISYPVEVLYGMKAAHEAWVRERVSPDTVAEQAEAAVYGNAVDLAEGSLFSRWERITEHLIAAQPFWRNSDIERVRSFRRRIITSLFPKKHPKLEAALVRLSLLLETAVTHFLTSSKPDEQLGAWRFQYKCELLNEYNDEKYAKLKAADDEFLYRHSELVREATKAANWVVRETRTSMNPFFRNDEGLVLAYEDYGLEGASIPYEYDPSEIAMLLEDVHLGLERAKTVTERYLSWAKGEG